MGIMKGMKSPSKSRVWFWLVLALVLGANLLVLWGQYRGLWTVGNPADSVLFPALGSSVLGLVLIHKVPANRIGWLFALMGVAGPLIEVVQGYQNTVVSSSPDWLAWFLDLSENVLFFIFIGGFLVFLPLWFPTGHIPHRRWAWVAPVFTTTTALLIVTMATGALTIEGEPGSFEFLLIAIWVASGPIAAFASAVSRYRNGETVERLQLKWLIWAFGLVVSGFVASIFLASFPGWLNDVFSIGSFSFLFFSVWWSITRHRLYEIDRILSRTVAYTLVVAVLGFIYFGVVTLVTMILPSQDSLAVAASTLTVAAVFNSLRRRVKRWVDRRFNRSAYQAEIVLQQFVARLQGSLTVEALARFWVETVVQHLEPESVGVWLNSALAGLQDSDLYSRA